MADFTISVVIPAYRCAGIIGKTIDSILAQTRRPDEIIVVDDGSPDDIAGALLPYGDAVKLIRTPNGGAASARNVGLDACSGDLIALIDSDDLWEPDKLASQLEVFVRHPEVGLVSSRYRGSGLDQQREYPEPEIAPWDQVLSLSGAKAFDAAMLVWTSVAIFRRATLGNERFDTSLKIAEDRDLWVRLVLRAPIYLQSRFTAIMVERPDSLSHADLDLDCASMLRVIGKHAHVLGVRGRHRWVSTVYRRWAGMHLMAGRARRAIRPALRRLLYQPFALRAWWIVGKACWGALLGQPLSR